MFKSKFTKKSKLFLSLILIITIVFVSTTPISATSSIQNNPELTFEFIRNSNASINNNVICFSKNSSQGNNEYVCETIFIVPRENISAEALLGNLTNSAKEAKNNNSRASITVEEFDPSISIEGWIQTYYSRINSGYGTASKVTSVSGGYDKSDRSVSVTAQTIIYGSSGKSALTGKGITQNDSHNLTSDYSWSYTAPSSWHHIVENAIHNIGANCTFYLKRYGSTWNFTIECIISEG